MASWLTVASVQVSLCKLNCHFRQCIDVQRCLLAGDLLGKAKQAGDEKLCVPYLVSNSFRKVALLAAERCFSEQVRISEHRRERIVDFVRSASHKLAKRGQFFRFNQLLLQASK